MNRQYISILQNSISNSFFNHGEGQDPNVHIVSTPTTKSKLRTYEIVSRENTKLDLYMGINGADQENDLKKRLKLFQENKLALHFLLSPQNMDFYRYTELPFDPNSGMMYLFNVSMSTEDIQVPTASIIQTTTSLFPILSKEFPNKGEHHIKAIAGNGRNYEKDISGINSLHDFISLLEEGFYQFEINGKPFESEYKYQGNQFIIKKFFAYQKPAALNSIALLEVMDFSPSQTSSPIKSQLKFRVNEVYLYYHLMQAPSSNNSLDIKQLKVRGQDVQFEPETSLEENDKIVFSLRQEGNSQQRIKIPLRQRPEGKYWIEDQHGNRIIDHLPHPNLNSISYLPPGSEAGTGLKADLFIYV
ncbi:MAG: hypothetical protein MRZ79_09065 [Bacteroidia bacterium]|nr:hypothetical protein [Bacteroidia bacterium]